MFEKQEEIKNRALEEARYIIDNHATVRQQLKILASPKVPFIKIL